MIINLTHLPFEFKKNKKNRYGRKSRKFYQRQASVRVCDIKKIRRIVKLRRIHYRTAVNVKSTGNKWWQKLMNIYYPQMSQQDIQSCSKNLSSNIIFSFQQTKQQSKSYFQLFTQDHDLELKEQQIIKVLFHGIGPSTSKYIKQINQYQYVFYKIIKQKNTQEDQIQQINPILQLNPSPNASIIKAKNIDVQYNIRSSYTTNFSIQYLNSISDEKSINQIITYHNSFKNCYNSLICQSHFLNQKLKLHTEKNKKYWEQIKDSFLIRKQQMNQIQSYDKQLQQLLPFVYSRDRLLYFRRGFTDKTQDQLQQALEEIAIQQHRLATSKKSKQSKIPSYNDCRICFNPQVKQNNKIIRCKGCLVSYHQHCYGLKVVQKQEIYVCDSCLYMQQKQYQYNEYFNRPYCNICFSRNDYPLKRIQNKFYHLTCLFCFTLIDLNKIEIMFSIEGYYKMAQLQKSKYSNKCEYCVQLYANVGMTIKCKESKCLCYFHPICAYLHGCRFMVLRQKQFKMQAKCISHSYDNEEDEIRQVYLRRFFCNHKNIQKITQNQFIPFYKQQKQLIEHSLLSSTNILQNIEQLNLLKKKLTQNYQIQQQQTIQQQNEDIISVSDTPIIGYDKYHSIQIG